ncbi:glycosylhydrolase-like jelly roll fold domain-containing protein [Gracilibacillus phocaeensis]|uniref:glycosylhydrolase-like jelly roll fold domain-containing protein n=1 Tax=Gracilibacillus phocaeensis TaxID=2042304 RepID=UPI00102F56D8|nr:glycosylhydrolase-like jelly roll fold domain-containing protein [Gracilibacillus phocaeensis]
MNNHLYPSFVDPPDEFSLIPFWFWNDHLSVAEIHRQIDDFYAKEVKGFVLHPRMGLPKDIPYLSDTFMYFVEAAVKKAHHLGMSVMLYDEGMYPSGAANGLVVEDKPEYASRGLRMDVLSSPSEGYLTIEVTSGEKIISVQAVKQQSDQQIERAKTVILEVQNDQVFFQPPEEGNWLLLIFVETFSQGHIRGIHFGEDDGEENAPRSADLLNPAAVEKFIKVTHDSYYQALKPYFGDTIIAMFTDEPDILGRGASPNLRPWTTGFLDFYKEQGNKESDLPVLWWEAGANTELIRKRFRKTIQNKLQRSYYTPVSKWCEQHDIALTGHPAASDDIGLLEAFQIPGQDVVWRWVGPEGEKGIQGEHSTAAKCSSDAARHRGRRRNLNEVLGACGKESGWSLSADDMKWYLDWLFVRGVNLLCPHAFYYSIRGEQRSQERPPDVGPNNLWWPYYASFSQYIKRMSWLMTDAVNDTSIAVLGEEALLPWRIVQPLYQNQIEFNYLEESLFMDKCKINNGKIHIRDQRYKVLIIEDSSHLQAEVMEKLKQFAETGGSIIVEQSQTNTIMETIATSISQPTDILQVLDDKPVHLSPASGHIRVSKLKKTGCFFYLLTNEGEGTYQGKVRLNEEGRMEKWDAWEGTIVEEATDENRYMSLTLPRRSSVIYYLDPKEKRGLRETRKPMQKKESSIILSSAWQATTPHSSFAIDKLTSWTEWKGMAHFSGKISYQNTFSLSALDKVESLVIDLGDVQQIASVKINQQPIGVKMWGPYKWEIKKSDLKVGKNLLRVEVINSIANQMDRMALPSGLIGPVSLTLVSRIEDEKGD